MARVVLNSPETATIPIIATDGGMYTLLVDRETAAWIERSWKTAR